jgi:hypothetical protein
MESDALWNLVKKIFGDENTKARFKENPDSVLSQFALTEQEKKAVLSTYFKAGLVTGISPQLETMIEPMDFWL